MLENRGPGLAALLAILVFLTCTTSLARIYVRCWILKAFRIDDWLMIITLMLHTLWQIDQFVGISHGIGQHLSILSPVQISLSLKCFWLSELGYISTTTMLKMAIGTLILRVTISRVDIVLVRVIMVLNGLFGVAFFFVAIFQCTPISHFWNPSNPGGKCLDVIVTQLAYAHSVLGIISEWIMVALPVRMIWKSPLNRRSKAIAICVIGFGAIGSTATIIRIPVIKRINDPSDFLYDVVDLMIYSSIEGGIGLTAVNIMTLRPLFKKLFSKVSSSSVVEESLRIVPENIDRTGDLEKENKPLGISSRQRELGQLNGSGS